MNISETLILPFIIAICIVLIFFIGVLWGAMELGQEIKNKACIATYESYKDILQCQEEKDFKDIIFTIKKDK